MRDLQPQGSQGRARNVPIPGAHARADEEDPRWAVLVTSASVAESASVDLSGSLQEGIFAASLQRRGSEHGYGSLGHGHGAWLSSSLRGGGMAAATRSPPLPPHPAALPRQSSLGSGVLSPPGQHAQLATHSEVVDLERANSGMPPSVLSPRSSAALADQQQQQQRPQRWHLQSGSPAPPGALESCADDLQEPLLSGEVSERALSGPTAAAAAMAEALDDPAKERPADADATGLQGPAARAIALAHGGGDGGQRGGTSLSKALVFGMINSVATIPSLVAFANVVFKDAIYTPYLDQLCKFFFLSSAVHQTVFCLLSTLPFSVGQVQDVGLIFLSAMATSIAGTCLAAGLDAATALGTSLLTMSVATFFTGLMTLLVARVKLAQLVQYLPLPVIGGYLSFVGYFCIASGIGLGTSEDIGGITSWANLFNTEAFMKFVPTVLSCLAMILTLEHFSHPLALPATLTAINLLFHGARLALGVSLEQAMDAGWVIRPAEGPQKFWELWDLFNIKDWTFSGIYFPALADQWLKILGLALVVIFGSAMDIAAIQQDTPQKIDFDRELVTVAVSNMATGVAGCGYTGSYIFSQTIFTMRAGVFSRWNGWVVAISEYAMFALPFPVIQYMPNFFFGSLLLWFGIEISRDWLVLSYTKMTRIEYGLLLATFSAIMQWGLEGGILAGIVLATLYFALAYAKSQVAAIEVVDVARSSVVRTVEQQAALDMLSGRLATVNLNGFIFFGSANTIGQKLQETAQCLGSSVCGVPATVEQQDGAEEAIENSRRTMGEAYVGVKHTQAVAALGAAPAYLVLDFHAVRGLDATGARTMGMVYRDLVQHGVVLVVTAAAHHDIRPLLLAHGLPLPPRPLQWPLEPASAGAADAGAMRGSVAGPPHGRPGSPSPSTGSLAMEQAWEDGQGVAAGLEDGMQASCLEFATLEQGLRYCEDQLLEVAVRYGLCQPPSALLPLEDMLRSHLHKLPLNGGLEPAAVVATLQRYISAVVLSAGRLLWRVDDPADELYIIEKGAIRVDEFVRILPDGGSAEPAERGSQDGPPLLLDHRSGSGQRRLARSYELGPGCVVGSTDFYLARPHQTRAVCRSSTARVLKITRAAMERMASEAPQALNVLQVAVMRANTLDLSQAAEQLPTAS